MSDPLVKVADLTIDSGKVMIDGEILATETRELKSGKILAMFNLFDGSSTITCKVFLEAEKSKAILKRMNSAKGVKVIGTAQFDPFAKELGVIANAIVESNGIKREVRQDNSQEKRVELHMHTQMSQMDAMTSAEDLLKRAVKWGMKSIAITDHGVVQAFPEAHKYLEKAHPDLKVIYGVEAYLAPDTVSCISFSKGQDLDATYCVLDLETTGLSFRTEKITEVGIMKVKNGEVIDEFSCFVKNNQNSLKCIAHCDEGNKKSLQEIYTPGQNATILIGPEGDFSGNEITLALANNFIPVTLGESRLRTETAGIVACHSINFINEINH